MLIYVVVLGGAVAQQITHLTAHVCSPGCGFGLSTSDNRIYIYIIFQSALIKCFFTFLLTFFTDLNCLMFSGSLYHLSGAWWINVFDMKAVLLWIMCGWFCCRVLCKWIFRFTVNRLSNGVGSMQYMYECIFDIVRMAFFCKISSLYRYVEWLDPHTIVLGDTH